MLSSGIRGGGNEGIKVGLNTFVALPSAIILSIES